MADRGVTSEPSLIITRLEQRKGLMSVKDVVEVTGLDDKTIYRWARAGTIPVVKFGYKVKFDPHQIARWMLEHYAV